jgi:hypothetical protein
VNKPYSIFINGIYRECELSKAFTTIYWLYIDALRNGQSIPPFDIQVVYNDTQAVVIFMLMDIIQACDKYAGWLGDMNYLLLKSGGIGALARKYLINKFENKKFTLKLEEEAVRKANAVH